MKANKKRPTKYGSDSIQIKRDLEGMRNRPTMYIGEKSIHGQNHTILELITNSVDEVREDNDNFHNIDLVVLLKKNEYQIILRDDCRGIPLGNNVFEQLFTILHSSGKYDESGAYRNSGGTFGVGAKAMAALGERGVVATKHEEGEGLLKFRNGKLIESKTNLHQNGVDGNGTIIFYEPDKSIFPDVHLFQKMGLEFLIETFLFTSVFVKNTSFRIFVINDWIDDEFIKTLTVENVYNTLNDYINQPTVQKNLYYSNDLDIDPMTYFQKFFGINKGIVWSLDNLNYSSPVGRLSGFQIKLFVTKSCYTPPISLNAVNMIRIKDQTSDHITILFDLVKQMVIDHILMDKKQKKYFQSFYKLPIYSAIMVDFENAVFIGQTKDAFKDKDFAEIYTKTLRKVLEEQNEQTWEQLAQVIQEDFYTRYDKYSNKGKFALGGKDITLSLINSKSFCDCDTTDRQEAELFIVEGESSFGDVKDARDSDFQAVFALKGKPTNILKTNSFNNSELFKDLVRILGVSAKETDMSKCNFGKIFITTDADAHGYHIGCIVVGCLYKINPNFFKEGMVYFTNPPLYQFKHGKQSIFYRDPKSLLDSRIRDIYSYALDFTLVDRTSGKKKHLNPEEFIYACYLIHEVGNIYELVGNRTMINPLLLEILFGILPAVKSLDLKTIKDETHADSVMYNELDNSLVITHEFIDQIIPLDNLVAELEAYVRPFYLKHKIFSVYVGVTTKLVPTYQNTIMGFTEVNEIFKSINKKHSVTHFKGLGQVKSSDLDDTCMNPSTRVVTQITGIGDLDLIYNWLGNDTEFRKKVMKSVN